MSETLYTSDRTFKIFLYTVSHSQLLLRSAKSETKETRIDLLFKDVDAMHVLPTLGGVRVAMGSPLDDASSRAARMFPSKNLYQISSGEFRGYVIAGVFAQKEDHREYFEPSSFKSFL